MSGAVVPRPPGSRRRRAMVRVDPPLYPLLDAAGKLSLQYALMWRRQGRPFRA